MCGCSLPSPTSSCTRSSGACQPPSCRVFLILLVSMGAHRAVQSLPKKMAAFPAALPCPHGWAEPTSISTQPRMTSRGHPSATKAISCVKPVMLCTPRCAASCADGRATAPTCCPAAHVGPPWSWMAVAAAGSALGAWESPATSCMSATAARGSSVTTARGQEAPATVSTTAGHGSESCSAEEDAHRWLQG